MCAFAIFPALADVEGLKEVSPALFHPDAPSEEGPLLNASVGNEKGVQADVLDISTETFDPTEDLLIAAKAFP